GRGWGRCRRNLFVSRCCCLAFFPNHCQYSADRQRVPRLGEKLFDHAVAINLNFDVCFFGSHHADDIATLYALAGFHAPFDKGAFLHVRTQARHPELSHACAPWLLQRRRWLEPEGRKRPRDAWDTAWALQLRRPARPAHPNRRRLAPGYGSRSPRRFHRCASLRPQRARGEFVLPTPGKWHRREAAVCADRTLPLRRLSLPGSPQRPDTSRA